MLIAEELLVLAHKPDNGGLRIGAVELDRAVEAALLSDLVLLRRIDVVAGRLTVLDTTPIGDVELDAVLGDLQRPSSKSRTPRWWMLSHRSAEVRERLRQRLVVRGVFSRQAWLFLGIIPELRFLQHNPAPRLSIMDRLTWVLHGGDPDERTAALLALLRSSRLDRKLFGRAGRARIKAIAATDPVAPSASVTRWIRNA